MPRSLDEQVLSQEQSYRWLKFGDVKRETGSRLVAAQYQAFSTNCLESKMSEEEIDSKRRLCNQREETIDHLTSGCPILAKNEYLVRHDRVSAH